MYSFHGQCDLVMATSPSFDHGLGLDLHARTEIVDESWSLISNIALRIGDEFFEVVNDNSHYFNGVKDFVFPFKLAGKYQISRTVEDVNTINDNGEEVIEQEFTYTVNLLHENAIVITNYRHMLSVNVATYLPDTHGMLGYRTIKGMMGRDPTTGVITDANEMGFQWQVREDEPMIFHEIKGQQYPELCRLPSPKVDQKRRRLRHTQAALDKATKACETVSPAMKQFCIDDVLQTGDVTMAKGYGW
jgi:hypothetical protein